ncbi:hypothetical protein [Fusobacterium sp.]|uniref:hypothetical protein n=1 Tax=Fusobacterium sp. TaxID=68766 RepID=UPI0029048DF8|nr:hypothetical protein [Fusobacterium sp.]MDU1911884.1 hypothetical protein [Fusobacterium sp.]
MNQLEERVYQNQEDEEIDLMELVKILLNHKLMLIVVTISIIFISGIAGYILNKKNMITSVVIELNYPELEIGLNPDKTPFLKDNLVSINTLNTVFAEFKKDKIKVKEFADFRNSLSIEGVIPDNVSQKIETALKKGETLSYYPTQYKVKLKEMNKNVLERLSIEAVEEFEEKYKPKSEILLMGRVNNIYDYDDYILLFNEKIRSLKLNFSLDYKINYYSKILGYSFNELNNRIDNIQNIELKKLESFLDIKGLSNSKNTREIKLRADIKFLNLRKEKLIGESKVIKNILDEYKPTNRQIVVPSMGELGIKLETENEYYSKLIEKYLLVNTSIENIGYEIKFKEEEISKIVYPTEEENKMINESINLLATRLNEVIEDANIINKEFYEVKYGNMIKILTPVEISNSGKPMILFLGVGAVLGLFASIFLIFICEFIKNYKTRFSFKN